MDTLFTLAAEAGHLGPDSLWADIAVPLGILIFVGPVFMLLRSNLGTRLGYLVMSTSLWGSTFLLALFWAFGAPGTPAFTGPQNLPGQDLDAYTPVWVPLAQDSPLVTEVGSEYGVIEAYPDGFSTSPGDVSEDEIVEGRSEIMNVFSGFGPESPYANLLASTDQAVDTQYAVAENGRPIIAVTYAATCQQVRVEDPDNPEEFIQALPDGCAEVGELPAADSELRSGENADVTLFAFLDRGNPGFPSYVMLAGTFFLFALHMVLLLRDESRTARELDEEQADVDVTSDDDEQAPVPA